MFIIFFPFAYYMFDEMFESQIVVVGKNCETILIIVIIAAFSSFSFIKIYGLCAQCLAKCRHNVFKFLYHSWMNTCYFMLHLVSGSQKDFNPIGQTFWCYEIDRKNKNSSDIYTSSKSNVSKYIMLFIN